MVITEDMLKSLLRGEISWDDFWSDESFDGDHDAQMYKPTWEDVDIFITKIRNADTSENSFRESMSYLFDYEDMEIYDKEKDLWESPFDRYYDSPDVETFYDPITPENAIGAILRTIASPFLYWCADDEHDNDINIDWRRILEDIDAFRKGDYSPSRFSWRWTLSGKLDAIRRFFHEDMEEGIDKDEIYEILDELCAKENPAALDIKAYLCYGGCSKMPCNWFTSRDCLLKLLQVADNGYRRGQYANTLGYIYYYGRCNNNVPDYDAALKYFILGAAYGYYESIYKLADMLKQGRAVPKDEYAARNMVEYVYNDTKNHYLGGHGISDFADAALRMANYAREEDRKHDALTYLLEADCAIKDRMKSGDFYGDDNVAIAISRNIKEVRAELEKEEDDYHELERNVYNPLEFWLDKGYMVSAKLKFEGKDCLIRFQAECDYGEYRTFLEYPGQKRIKPVKTLKYRFRHVTKFRKSVKASTFKFRSIDYSIYGKPSSVAFMSDAGTLCSFNYTKCLIEYPGKNKNPEAGESHVFASCYFNEGGRCYDYLADDIELRKGDKVIVSSREGESEVTVDSVSSIPVGDLPIPIEKYRKVLRKV